MEEEFFFFSVKFQDCVKSNHGSVGKFLILVFEISVSLTLNRILKSQIPRQEMW